MNNYPRKLTTGFSESANNRSRTIPDIQKINRESDAGVSSSDTADCLNGQYDSTKFCTDNGTPLKKGVNGMGILRKMRQILSKGSRYLIQQFGALSDSVGRSFCSSVKLKRLAGIIPATVLASLVMGDISGSASAQTVSINKINVGDDVPTATTFTINIPGLGSTHRTNEFCVSFQVTDTSNIIQSVSGLDGVANSLGIQTNGRLYGAINLENRTKLTVTVAENSVGYIKFDLLDGGTSCAIEGQTYTTTAYTKNANSNSVNHSFGFPVDKIAMTGVVNEATEKLDLTLTRDRSDITHLEDYCIKIKVVDSGNIIDTSTESNFTYSGPPGKNVFELTESGMDYILMDVRFAASDRTQTINVSYDTSAVGTISLTLVENTEAGSQSSFQAGCRTEFLPGHYLPSSSRKYEVGNFLYDKDDDLATPHESLANDGLTHTFVGDLPEVSISATTTQIDEGGNTNLNISTASTPASAFSVTVEYTEVGNYLDPTTSETISVDAMGNGSTSLKTIRDNMVRANGTITAKIKTDTSRYEINESMKEVQITVNNIDIPNLSIATDVYAVNEGESFTFTVTSTNGNVLADLPITLETSRTGYSYLNAISPNPSANPNAFKITQSANSITGTVSTHERSQTDGDGLIRIRITDTMTYDVDTDNSNVAVRVNDKQTTRPTVSITAPATYNLTQAASSFNVTINLSSAAPVNGLNIPLEFGFRYQSYFSRIDQLPESVTVEAGATSATASVGISGGTMARFTGDGLVIAEIKADTTNYILNQNMKVSETLVLSLVRPPAGTSIIRLSPSEIDEGVTLIFQVSFSSPKSTDTRVNLSIVGGGSFFASTPNSYVDIEAGESTAFVELLTVDDGQVEADSAVTVSLLPGTGYMLTTVTGFSYTRFVARIEDNDAGTGLTISTPMMNEGASGSTTEFTFTVTLGSAALSGGQPFSWRTRDGTAKSGSDYVEVGRTESTIAQGGTTAEVKVTVNGDEIYEPNETFFVDIFFPGNDGDELQGSGTGTIINDDTAPVLSIADGETVAEAVGAMATFIVTSATDPGADPIEVHYTASETSDNNTASFLLAPDDAANPNNNGHVSGQMTSAMLTFQNGGTGTGPFTAMLQIPLANDEVVEAGTHTISVVLNVNEMITHYGITPSASDSMVSDPATITVIDDDSLPKLTLTSPEFVTGTTVEFLVESDREVGSSGLTFELEYRTGGTNWQDFSPTQTIAAGGMQLTIPNVPLTHEALRIKPEPTKFRTDLLGNNGITVLTPTVEATSTTPGLSIEHDGTGSIFEGQAIRFKVYATPIPFTTDLSNVEVEVSQRTSDDFIDETRHILSGQSYTHTIQTIDNSTGEVTFYVYTKPNVASDASGEITATIQDSADSSYVTGTMKKSARVSVMNTTLPILSVAPMTGGEKITEGGDINFVITALASTSPGTGFAVDYRFSQSPVGFISNLPTTATPLNFTPVQGEVNTFSASVAAITTTDNSVKNDRGTVTLTLWPDDDGTREYVVRSEVSGGSAEVAVLDNEVPELSIATNGVFAGMHTQHAFTEGVDDYVEFLITATQMPSPATLPIMYSETDPENYLVSRSTSQPSYPSTVTFSDDGSGNFTARLRLPLADNEMTDTSGSGGIVSVQLENIGNLASANYRISTKPTESMAAAEIRDDESLPLLSVSRVDGVPLQETTDTNAGAKFKLTLVSSNPVSTMTVYYELTEEGGDMITGNSSTESFSLLTNFSADATTTEANDYTANFSGVTAFGIIADNVKEPSGIVKVTLISSTDPTMPPAYKVKSSPDNSATVKILDDDLPELSIEGGAAVVEAEGAMAKFTVSASIDPGRNSVEVFYTPTETGNFLLPRIPEPPAARTNNGHKSGIMESVMVGFENGGSGSGPYTYELNIPIENDEIEESNGEITVQLNAEANLGGAEPKYAVALSVAGEDMSMAAVMVADDDSLPELTLVGPDFLPQGGTVDFAVESDREVASGGLTFSLEYTTDGTTWLDYVPAATLTIIGNEKRTTVPGIPSTYNALRIKPEPTKFRTELDGEDGVAVPVPTVSVSRTTPGLSIEHVGTGSVIESETILFRVYSTPGTFDGNLTDAINITVTQSGSNYIDDQKHPFTSGEHTVPALTMLGSTGEAYFSIATVWHTLFSDSGFVTATIEAGTGYVTGTNTKATTVRVDNTDLPILSVRPRINNQVVTGETPIVTEGDSFEFQLTAVSQFEPRNHFTAPGFDVSYEFSDRPMDFITAPLPTDTTLNFSGTEGNFTATIGPIEVDMDTTKSNRAELTLTLMDSDGNYIVSSDNRTATVIIRDDDVPELSIRSKYESFTEGVDTHAEFIVESHIMPSTNPLPISYSISELNSKSYVDKSMLPTEINFAPESGKYLATLAVPIVDNQVTDTTDGDGNLVANAKDARGRVTAQLLNSGAIAAADYVVSPEVSESRASVDVYDDESLPLFSIYTTGGPLTEGVDDDARSNFEIAAEGTDPGSSAFKVYYRIEETGDLMVSADSMIKSDDVIFSADGADFKTSFFTVSPKTTNFDIASDDTGENSSLVTVTLENDQERPRRYKISGRSATLKVLDDDVPELSIEAGDAVIEADGAIVEFTVASSFEPDSAIVVHYTPRDTGDFLLPPNPPVNPTNNGHTSGVMSSVSMSFRDESDQGDGPFTYSLEIPLADDDVEEPGNHSITVQLNQEPAPGAMGRAYTVADAAVVLPIIGIDNSMASVTVIDDDFLPYLTLAAPEFRTSTTYNATVISDRDIGSSGLTFDFQYSTDGGTTWSTDRAGGEFSAASRSTTITAQHTHTALRLVPAATKFRTAMDGANGATVLSSTIESTAATPGLSIEHAGSGSVLEGAPIRFRVFATPTPFTTDLSSVSVVVTQGTEDDFIDETAHTLTSGEYTHSIATILASEGEATFDIMTKADITSNDEGEITATIQAGTGYVVGTRTNSATVAVKNSNLPKLSVAPKSGGEVVLESQNAEFVVTAVSGVLPITGAGPTFTVTYSFEQEGSFFATLPSSVPLTFSGSSAEGFTAPISVMVPENSDKSDRGAITVTLAASSNYELSDTVPITATVEIQDNDVAELSLTAVEPTFTEGVDDNVEFVVTAHLMSQITNPVTVHYATPTDTGNFLETVTNAQQLTFAANQDGVTGSAVLEFPITNDEELYRPGNDAVSIQLENESQSAGAQSTYRISTVAAETTATVTVGDDESLPKLTIEAMETNGKKSVIEEEIAKFTVKATYDRRLTRPPNPENGFPVRYSIGGETDGFITANSEVTGMLDFKPVAESSFEFTADLELQTVDNNKQGASGSITVNLLADSNGAMLDRYAVVEAGMSDTVKVFDKDIPELSIIGDGSITEAQNGSANFTVTSGIPVTGTIDVYYTATGSNFIVEVSAGSGTTYSLDFDGGTTASMVIPLISDNLVEDNQDVVVALTADQMGADYTVSPTGSENMAAVTVTDDDSLPIFSVVPVDPTIQERESARFTVIATYGASVASPEKPENSSVRYMIEQGEMDDFIAFFVETDAPIRTNLNFTDNNGVYTASLPEIQTIHDEVGESTGEIVVTLLADDSAVAQYRLSDDAEATMATVRVFDDDIPELSITGGGAVIEAVGAKAVFTVHATFQQNQQLNVHYTPVDSSNFLDTDFHTSGVSRSKLLDFSRPDSDGTVDLTTASLEIELMDNDNKDPQIHTITVTLEDDETGTDYTVSTVAGENSAIVSVFDDDSKPITTIAPKVSEIAEGNSAEFIITMSSTTDPGSGFSVPYTVTQTGGLLDVSTHIVEPLDFSGSGGIFTASIAIPVPDNEVPNFNGTVTITLDEVQSGDERYVLGSPKSATVTINDDGYDGLGLAIADAMTDEGADGSTSEMLSFKVSLTAEATATVTFDWEISGGTAAATEDYIASSGTNVMIPSGSSETTITVEVISDDVPEPDETVTVLLTNVSGAELLDGMATGTISNDDGVGLSIEDNSIAEADANDTSYVSFTVSLSAPVSQDVTFDWETSDGTAVSPDDYVAVPETSAMIRAGQTSTNLTVQVAGDDDLEDSETFTVSISNPSSGVTIVDGTATGTIINDDGQDLRVSDRMVSESGDGTTAQIVFTVALDAAAAEDVKFDWQTQDDTAVAGEDYTAGSGTETITMGGTNATITISLTNDAIPESDETFKLILSNPSKANIADGEAVGIIENDDGVLVSVSGGTVSEGAAETTAQLEFTVSLFPPAESAVTVEWETADGTATAGSDYVQSSGTISNSTQLDFAIGESSKKIMVTVNGDDLSEADETVMLRLTSASTGAALASNPVGTGMIADDDTEVLSVVSSTVAAPVLEGDAGTTTDITFTVSLARPSDRQIDVEWVITDLTATEGLDFVVGAGVGSPSFILPGQTPPRRSVTFAANDNSDKTITVTVNGDALDERDETFMVTLTYARRNGANAKPLTATATISDDDVSVISIAPPTQPVAESGNGSTTDMTFTLNKSIASDRNISVDVATSDGESNPAVMGQDYVAKIETVTFAANETTKDFIVTVNDDNRFEGMETLEASLYNPTEGATLAANHTAVGTISSPDTTQISVVSSTATTPKLEGGPGDLVPITFTANLTNPSDTPITVDWATSTESTDNAVAGTDYVAASGQVTFTESDPAPTFVVNILGDNEVEEDKTFTVTLSNPTAGANLAANPTATATITDDDTPSLSIADASIVEGADGETIQMEFTITLDPVSSQDVTVLWSTGDAAPVSATAGTDYTASGNTGPSDTPLSFTAGESEKTIMVPIAGDNIDELDETFTVTLSMQTAGVELAKATAVGTIVDDDGVEYTIAFDRENAPSEGNAGATSTLVFNVTKTGNSDRDITLNYATSDGTAVATESGAGDYEADSSTITFAAGTPTTKSISVTVNGDDDAEQHETFTVTLTNPADSSVIDSATGTIYDDDHAFVSVSDTTVLEVDDGGTATMTFKARLAQAVANDVTVGWRTSDAAGSAAAGVDFESVSSGSITFPANDVAEQDMVVTIMGDNIAEGDETVVVTLTSSSGGATLAANPTATGTIVDNDIALLTIADATTVTENTDGTAAEMVFTVSKSIVSSDLVLVYADVLDGTAIKTRDYTAASGTALEFPAGDNSDQTFRVMITDDADHEQNETLSVQLSNPTGNAKLGTKSSATGTIIDADAAPIVSIEDVTVLESVATGSVQLTIELSGSSYQDVTVSYQTESVSGVDTATAGDDYVGVTTPVAVTIPAGQTSKTFLIEILDDNTTGESSETFTVKLTSAAYARFDERGIASEITATVNIRDDEGLPTITTADVVAMEADGIATVELVLSETSAEEIQVSWSTSEGGSRIEADSGVDFTASASMLSIPSGMDRGSIQIPIVNDTDDEQVETFVVTLENVSNARFANGTTETVTVTIQDDDAIMVSVMDASVTEGSTEDATLMLEVALSGSSYRPVTIYYATRNGSNDNRRFNAVAPFDFTAETDGVLTVTPGAETATIVVPIISDDQDELNETFSVELTGSVHATIDANRSSSNVTIVDADEAPTISMAANVSVQEDVADGYVSLTVNLSRSTHREVTFRYMTTAMTATDQEDYIGTGQTLAPLQTIRAGTTSHTIRIPIVNDTNDEVDETFTVTLTNLNSSAQTAGGAVVSSTITIVDDNDVVAVSIPGVFSVAENIEGGKLKLPVLLSGTSHEDITLSWTTEGDSPASAIGGTDYTAVASGQLTIAADQESGQSVLEVYIADDTNSDGNLTFLVQLSSVSSPAQLGTATTTTVSILDDETARVLTVTSTSVQIDEGVENGEVMIDISISESVPLETVSFEVILQEVQTASNPARRGLDFEDRRDRVIIMQNAFANRSFSVPIANLIIDDEDFETEEQFELVLRNPDGAIFASGGGSTTPESVSVMVTIADNDPMPVISIESTKTVLESNGMVEVSVRLDRPSFEIVTVGWSTTDGVRNEATDTDGAMGSESVPSARGFAIDYTTKSDTLTFQPGEIEKFAIVEITNDLNYERNETFHVNLSNATGAMLAQTGNSSLVTIGADGDEKPTVSLAASENSVNEGSAEVVLTVNLTGSSYETVSLNYMTEVDSDATNLATADTDYNSVSMATPPTYQLSIIPGEIAAEIRVGIVDDSIEENAETFAVSIGNNLLNALPGNILRSVVTIVDNEGLPVISFSENQISIGSASCSPSSGSDGSTYECFVSEDDANLPIFLSYSHATVNTVSVTGRTATVSANLPYQSAVKNINFRSVDGEARFDTATRMLEYQIEIVDNEAEENDKVFQVEFTTPVNAVFASGVETLSARITIVEDDIATVSITAESEEISEGGSVEFTISSSSDADLNGVSISFIQQGGYIFSPVRRSFDIAAGAEVSFSVNTVDDNVDGDDGWIELSILRSSDFRVHPLSGSARVAILDNDTGTTTAYSVASAVIRSILLGIPETVGGEAKENTQAEFPAISITALADSVSEGEYASFRLNASKPSELDLTINLELEEIGEFIGGGRVESVQLSANAVEVTHQVLTVDDDIAERNGSVIATVLGGDNYLAGQQDRAVVVITDETDRFVRQTDLQVASREVLSQVMVSVGARSLDAAADRVASSFTGGDRNSEFKLGGADSLTAMLKSGGQMLNEGGMDWQEVLGGSSFTVNLFPEDTAVGSTTFWGVGDHRELSGDGQPGAQSWEGDILAGHIGFDTRIGLGMLAGLTTSATQSEILYGKNRRTEMLFDTRTTGLHPYLGYTSVGGNMQLQVMAGYGTSEIVIDQEKYAAETFNGTFHTFGLGGIGKLFSSDLFITSGSSSLNVEGVSWLARQNVNAFEGITDKMQVRANHTRLAVKGSHDQKFTSGDLLAPSISLGFRGDGLNDMTTYGLELESGVRYSSPNGLTVSGTGQTLMSGLNQIHEWELRSSLDYDSNSDKLGVLINISPKWGGTGSVEHETIWSNSILDVSGSSSLFTDGRRFESELGYGFNIGDDSIILTPYGGIDLSDAGTDEYSIGSRFSMDRKFNIKLEGVRSTSENGDTDTDYRFKGNLRW